MVPWVQWKLDLQCIYVLEVDWSLRRECHPRQGTGSSGDVAANLFVENYVSDQMSVQDSKARPDGRMQIVA